MAAVPSIVWRSPLVILFSYFSYFLFCTNHIHNALTFTHFCFVCFVPLHNSYLFVTVPYASSRSETVSYTHPAASTTIVRLSLRTCTLFLQVILRLAPSSALFHIVSYYVANAAATSPGFVLCALSMLCTTMPPNICLI